MTRRWLAAVACVVMCSGGALASLASIADAAAPAAAPAAASAPATPASAGDQVLLSLQQAEAAQLVRHALVRDRALESVAHLEARDTSRVDASWLLRFERECSSMPVEPCRERPLVPGQIYEYVLFVSAGDVSARVDFRIDCVRLMRGGAEVEARSLRGSREPMALLLLRANPRDKAMVQLAQALGVAPVDPSPGRPVPVVVREEIPSMDARPDVDELAEPVSRSQPDYPDIARDAGVQGKVTVMALVGTDGHVRQTRITKSIPMLDDAALACVRRWVFKPAMKDGQPVPVWVAVPVTFKLH